MPHTRDRIARPPLPLPTREGVGPSCVALPTGPWATIAECLVARFPGVAASVWAARIAAGEVVDENGRAVDAARVHQPGLRVYYYRALETETPIPFEEEVLFQDAHLVVVDKPHFLPVTPTGRYVQQSLLVRLKRRLGIDMLVPVHRIDRETAGLVLFSVQPATRGAYSQLFAERQVQKHYEAIVPWPAGATLPAMRHSRLAVDRHFMRMAEVYGEANAETHFRLLAHGDGRAHLALSPVTGRKHQLRVHCAALGLPIVNDLIYPTLQPEGSNDFARPLQLLARAVAFTDPLDGRPRHFTSARTLALALAQNPATAGT